MLLGLLVLALGSGFLAVAWNRWHAGQVPAASRGLSAHRRGRADNPFAARLFLLLFMALGGWLVVYALLLLIGAVAPSH